MTGVFFVVFFILFHNAIPFNKRRIQMPVIKEVFQRTTPNDFKDDNPFKKMMYFMTTPSARRESQETAFNTLINFFETSKDISIPTKFKTIHTYLSYFQPLFPVTPLIQKLDNNKQYHQKYCMMCEILLHLIPDEKGPNRACIAWQRNDYLILYNIMSTTLSSLTSNSIFGLWILFIMRMRNFISFSFSFSLFHFFTLLNLIEFY